METKALEQSTRLLVRLAKNEATLVEKVDILEQVFNNLKVLKINMSEKEYSRKFEALESRVLKIIDDLTAPSFVKELVDKIKALNILEKNVG